MEEVFHVLEEDNTERFIPVRRAAEYAKDMRDAGKTFKYLEDWKGKDGETIPVAPERREEFLADMKAQGVTPERVRPITRDGRRVYHLSDGEQFEVAAHREEEFFSDMEAAGREVVRDEPAVDFLSDEEADDALSGGIDWAEVGKSAAQGWKFPVRLAMNVAEGAVAIPTLAVMAGEYGLAKAGVLEEGEHPLGKHGLKAMRAIEGAKPEYRLDTGSESWRDPSGIVHNVASGSLGALEFLGEIAATAGLSGAVKTVAKKGVKEGAKQIGKEVASGVLRVAQELPSKTIKGVAKRVAREAAEGAVFEGATATAGVAGRSMATEAENRAARKAAETLGIASLDVTDWAAATAFAEAYARQLPRELLKEGSKRFAKQALKPNYWKLNMVSRNALETYEAFASTGSDEDKAMLNALGDGALGYLLLSLGDGAGAFSGGLRAGGATQLLRALTQGASKPWLKAELAGTAIRMLGGATAQGGSTYGHLRMLQEALGEDAVDDDTLRGSTVVAGVFGAGMGALSSIIPIRQAIAYDKELALGRQAMADGGPAWRPSEGQRGWARLDFPEGGTRQDGMPGAQSPAPFRPVAVHESGDVLFKDGSIWRAKTQDWLMPGGAVVDSHGDVVTVAPGMRGASTGDARREHRATGQNGAEDLGLFELIRSGETKVYNVPLAEIQPNTQIIQFKADADPVTGVVRGQELQGEYQALPSKPVLLWQAADGHLEPATGRHRIDLARRNGMETIPANIIREADGWTPERTRLLDAMDNILDEKGSDQDFVAFFRGTDLDRETAKRKGLLARKKGRDAFEVAKNGSEDLYSLVMGHDPWVTMDKAAAISREAPKTYGAFAEGVQRAVVKAVRERNLTADGAAIMARGLMSAHRQRVEAGGVLQDDLFGADDTALAFAAEEASYADGKRREALRALRRVNAALDKGDALDLKDDFAKSLGIQDPKNAEQLKAAANRLRETVTRWENYHTDPELYAEAHAYAKQALGIPDVVVERQDGTLTTDRELSADLHPEGTDALGGAPDAEGETSLRSIGPLYTGAGVAYERPSLVAVNSGEGAQVYGWGLYASDRPGVARSYAEDRRRVWNGLDYEEDASFVPESGVLASPSPEGFRSEAPVSQAEIDAAANGPGFVPLEKGESLNRLEKQLRGIKDVPLRNERLGLTSSIATNNNVSKLSVVNRDGGENVEAHKFAMKNLQGIYANAKIGVRHRDKKLVGNKRSNGNYIRLFAPFRFDGQTYVALISQRESDVAPGVHAIEALEVVPLENNKAEGEPVYSSGHGRSSHFDGPATPVPSALTEEKVAYTLGDVNQTHPVYLDGRPCTPEGLLEDLQEMVTRFELGATRERVATGPSGSGDLAERTGTGEAGGVESTEGPATLDSRKSRVMIEEPKLIFGERVLPGKPYPMYGQVAPLGGAPGSPAREQGRIALGLPDLVMMYHELTGGHLPKVISNRARMGSALGRYFVGKNTIELAAQIFGFLDETDVIALHQRLEKEGYFRHMNPEWARTHDARTVKFERRRSEQKLKKEIQTLSKKRIREQHEGYREVSVMAHELWHLIDDQDGGLAKRGNLIGHLAALKKYTKEAFPVEGFASNRELMEEAKAFIPSWRGVTNPMDTAYFILDPAETLAEIGGAYLTAPKALRERAPKLYDAWTFALAQHPKAQEAYDRAVAYIAGGEKAKRLAMMQGRTWTREAQRTMRALKNQATGTDHSLKRWRMRLNAYLWDRRGPAIMLYNEASRDSLKALRAELRKGVIGQADYEAAKARFGDGLAFLKKRHLDYTRLGSGLSRLYLADVRGELEARLAEVDPNPEIARAVMDEYAFNKRVLELKGRAAAYGTTVGDARAILNDMARTRGLDGMRKVATAWRTFRAIYEREVIENASVQRMLGPEAIDLMRANTSYVTMRHTLTPEQAGRLAKRLTDRKKANGAALEIALERLLPRGGEPGGAGAMNQLRQLKGSLQATESPLLATMKTAVGLITAAERNAAVADLAKALVDSGHVEARIVPWGEAVANMRHAPIEFWEGGEHKALMVPTIVARGFKESDDQTLKVLTHATRFINATFTTNNPGFVPRAQIKDFGSASLNIPGLWRMPVHYIDPVVGDVAALGLQFVPPHIMRKIGQTPVLKKFLNPHTVEYWSSFGNKMARMIHSADFVGALEEARRARASGNEAKARELEFLVQMCRSALRDGVLLNMIQFRRMEYDDSEWEALFARYNLDFDELPPEESRKLSPRQLPGAAWGLAKKGWNKIGDASEIASMTTKLGVYCYLHRDATPEMGDVTQAPSFADPLRRAVAAYRAATLAGDPTFELRGHLMTFIELTSGPFLNARQKGFLRAFDVDGKQPWLTDSGDFRMLSGPGQTAEKTLKVTAHFVRRFYYGALLAGGLSAATLGLYRLLTGNEEATEEEMEGTALGSLNTFFRWSEGVLRNCTPYTLLNFWTAPVWSKGDVSVVFCTPVSDEERVLNLLMDAALNQAGLPTINPTTGLSEVTEEVFGNLMNPLGGQGSLSEYRMLLASWLESQNPFDPFRNRPVLSEEEYAARWTEPNAAKTMAWRAVGASPLSLVLKPSDVRNDEIPAGPLRAFHAFVTRTPVLSSVLGGFLRFQIGGETARKRLVERADEQEVMRWKLRATNDYKEFAKTGGFTPPEDIPPDFVPDYEKRFIELINEAAARAKPGAKRREQLEEMAKSALRLRNPQLRAWQLRSLKRELELGE